MSSIPGPLNQTAKFSFTWNRQYSMAIKTDSNIHPWKRKHSWVLEQGISSCSATNKIQKFEQQKGLT
jgi:hypothetical protein